MRRRGKPYADAQCRRSDKSDKSNFVTVRSVAEIADLWHAKTGQRLSHGHVRMILIVARRKIASALSNTHT